MQLHEFNPWWKISEIPEELTGKRREILAEIISYLDYRQILLLFGIRRAGKTTLMHQLITHLLEDLEPNPFHILYFSFDWQDHSLDRVLDIYQTDILKGEIRSKERIYLFIDEIQKLKDWPNRMKILYDRHPNMKIVLSGSAALPLQRGTKESLAGRFFQFHITPFSFGEFIEFKSVSIDKTREHLYEREMKILFGEYLNIGGFVEAIPFSEAARKKYFKESLLERVIYRDIPETFQIANPGLLFRLMDIFADIPGMYLDYKHLGNDLKTDQRTIASYVSYLTYSLLLRKLYNYSPNRLTSEKKLKRVYLSNTAFLSALTSGKAGADMMMETFFTDFFKARFFYRTSRQEEVDIVVDNGNAIIPVEVKIREKIRPDDLRTVKKFMARFPCEQGLLISKHDEKVIECDGQTITILPYWKYWSINDICKA